MKKIILTGGGTAGHVTPNIALLDSLKENDFEVSYIGSYNGIEKSLIEKENIPYYGIATGKLRRYFDLKNFTDIFRVLKGYFESKKLLKELKPDIVFSKGGFVAVPVVRAAAKLKIPCVIHESDMTPGLANRLCIPVAAKVCCNFPETVSMCPANKAVYTGSPIRSQLFDGDRERGRVLCGFDTDKPVIMIIGGSQGAASINQNVRECLDRLLDRFNIVHLCGKDKVDNMMLDIKGYKQFEYLNDELKDVYALADIVISRAGANAIMEILALSKPNILIPLASGSRGDQLLNAASFEEKGYSMVIKEEALDPGCMIDTIDKLYESREEYIANMKKQAAMNPVDKIIGIILEEA